MGAAGGGVDDFGGDQGDESAPLRARGGPPDEGDGVDAVMGASWRRPFAFALDLS